ncbi:NAD(P)-binding protein [Oceanobacillus sp. 143]|nr:NAD(P)-binding protein [Oceanobacillus sp. 143]
MNQRGEGMTTNNRFVIIGAGMAGLNAAATLRNEGYKNEIMLLDKNSNLPYDRPPLSKGFLTGELDEEQILLRSPNFYDDNNIKLNLSRSAIRLDLDKQLVELDNHETVTWDKL